MEGRGQRAEQVRALLEELHEVLGERGAVEPPLEEALRDMLHEVREALDRAHDDSDSAAEGSSLAERIEALTVEFEAAHPTLAGVVNRLTHQLASLGI